MYVHAYLLCNNTIIHSHVTLCNDAKQSYKKYVCIQVHFIWQQMLDYKRWCVNSTIMQASTS